MLYKVGEELYCSEANSTAYKFPLTNANILQREHLFAAWGYACREPHLGMVGDIKGYSLLCQWGSLAPHDPEQRSVPMQGSLDQL